MKADADKIINFMDKLANESWLGASRLHWVKYLFHHTDVLNAVEILKSEKFLCRRELEKNNSMPIDNASKSVISITEADVKDYVRLYFRPRNPTQYRNEGVRTKSQQWAESHCPVPIFFLFDSKAILTRSDSKFSDGNLAVTGVQGLYSTANDLSSFDFRKIYHDSPHNNQTITYHKNAEVVVPNELDLVNLKYIVCRTPAERETLLDLLPKAVFNKWSSKILIDTKANFFFRRWSFIQTVDLTTSYIEVDFSPEAINPYPFTLTTKISGEKSELLREEKIRANQTIRITFDNEMYAYQIKIMLDENLVYSNGFDEGDEIPF